MGKVWLTTLFLHRESLEPIDRDLANALTALWRLPDATLVGHAADGLIWGLLRDGDLSLAPNAPKLRGETLLHLRLFDEEEELRLWRTGEVLGCCRIHEAETGSRYAAYRDQSYELLRDPDPKAMPNDGAFVEMRGRAGERHCPPGSPIRTRLRVRHYFEQNPSTGLLRTAEHRWLGLE
jgi:CRISPR-associated protein (TIGR03984 family)